jgi:hypothetical protein
VIRGLAQLLTPSPGEDRDDLDAAIGELKKALQEVAL